MAKVTWSRVVMNQEIDRLINSIVGRLDKLNLLEISGCRWTVSGENGKHKTMNYPEYDICELKLNEKFNLIIAEMVWEHLPYPNRAGNNVYAMLDTPGFFVISVPFMYPIHNHPIDCTRWTPIGLRYFLSECGFDLNKIHTNSWGNKDCVISHNQEPIYYDAEKHSLINDPNMPVSVWAVAQK